MVEALRHLTPDMEETLRRRKEGGLAQKDRTDFIWHSLLQSFATMGNARGWDGLIGNEENYNRYRIGKVIFSPGAELLIPINCSRCPHLTGHPTDPILAELTAARHKSPYRHFRFLQVKAGDRASPERPER